MFPELGTGFSSCSVIEIPPNPKLPFGWQGNLLFQVLCSLCSFCPFLTWVCPYLYWCCGPLLICGLACIFVCMILQPCMLPFGLLNLCKPDHHKGLCFWGLDFDQGLLVLLQQNIIYCNIMGDLTQCFIVSIYYHNNGRRFTLMKQFDCSVLGCHNDCYGHIPHMG